jgi:hypothetical protein
MAEDGASSPVDLAGGAQPAEWVGRAGLPWALTLLRVAASQVQWKVCCWSLARS